MSQDSDFASNREALRRQIAQDHGLALYRHYPERDAAAFLGIHPVTLKKIRLGGLIACYPRAGARSSISDFRSPTISLGRAVIEGGVPGETSIRLREPRFPNLEFTFAVARHGLT